ncbi:conserved hypothetical protein [uncultured Paludibacter sp.]|nr:conserved hypothetical protein [uncultured Paludibacter sp.]
MKIKHIYILILVVLFYSCNDMQDVPRETSSVKNKTTTGLLVLSEGLFNMNNSTLALYDFTNGKLTSDYFSQKNQRGLGDTANDMLLYGNKIYIAVNVSSQIEVIDANTGISLKRIPLFNENNVARQPRYLVSFGKNVYVTTFDGYVSRIDTASLTITDYVKCGKNPEGLCIANNKIYVANSGGLDFPMYDNTVSVIDISTFKEIKKIEVGKNPYKIFADSQEDVYVCTRGNYGSEPYHFIKIDTEIDKVMQEFEGLNVLNFTIFNDIAYLYSFDFNKNEYWIKTFDCLTEKIVNENFIKDKNQLKTPYSIQVNPYDGDVYVTDAIDYMSWGDIVCFDKDGNFKFSLKEIGLNPNKIIFIK